MQRQDRAATTGQQQSADRSGTAAGGGGQEGGDKGRLGAFLCWAVVFADIGTSVYYTPGILFGQSGVGTHAALFVGLTLIVFILLTRKYAEVVVRYPEGGGVVTVATSALSPFAGLVGGLFILVDYFLTAALSALSGFFYLSDVAPGIKNIVLPLALVALVLLALLNLMGVSESAKVNAAFAIVAALSQLAVVLSVIVHVGPGQLIADLPRVLNGPRLTGLTLLTGYAGAFLAFSGLESISQLSPVMAAPRRVVSRRAMTALVASMVLTSPLLTLWSTTVLPVNASTDPNQFISLLGGYAGGRGFEIEVAISGALLLVFASNTALIGSYHVFLALAKLGFLPQALLQRNKLRGTPHWAILVSTVVPLLVLIATQGSASLLGDLYAFGLLGAFSVTCISLDIVRWHERHPETSPPPGQGNPGGAMGAGMAGKVEDEGPTGEGRGQVGRVTFVLGVLTTVLVALAWGTNLFAKPLATAFGGGVTVLGLLIAFATYQLGRRKGRPFVFPMLHRAGYPTVFLSRGRRARPSATVLALLPDQAAQVAALVAAADQVAAGSPVVFVRRGTGVPSGRPPRLFEIVNPYLDDPAAQEAFAEAERLGREHGEQHRYRYLYLPSGAGPDAVRELWGSLRPKETVAVAGADDGLSSLPVERVYDSDDGDGEGGQATPIRHYVGRK
jgi:amino acid transporter